MKIIFFWVGKTNERWLQDGIEVYLKRLKHYISLTVEIIQASKNMSKNDIEKQKDIEGDAIIAKLSAQDEVYLLDEHGLDYTSEGLADFLQKKMSCSTKRIVLVVGGAYGFSEKMYHRANGLISFSKLTFSHQIIRLLVCEQLYRAFTIIRGEAYHHQ